MNILYAFLYLAALGGFYAIVYTMNKKTPVPEGCEDLTASCGGCMITSCGNYRAPIKEQEAKG